MKPASSSPPAVRRGQVLSTVLFGSRWLQVPLYLGLIIAQCVYVVHFMVELQHLVMGTMTLTEEKIMLIHNGKNAMMSFKDDLTPAEIEAVTDFVEQLH